MPAKYDRCVKKVRARIKSGKIPKTYKANGRKKSNPYAICSHLRAKGTKNPLDYLVWGTSKKGRIGGKVVKGKKKALELKKRWKVKFPDWRFFVGKYK
jgi:hypothetical protein